MLQIKWAPTIPARFIPPNHIGFVDEIAAAILFLASDEASYVIRAELAVDGGWSAGYYNIMLSGAPEDTDYGLRSEAHATTCMMEDALKAKAEIR